jgi:hypothetical protein
VFCIKLPNFYNKDLHELKVTIDLIEPIIRIYTESPMQQEADVLAERFVNELKVTAGI